VILETLKNKLLTLGIPGLFLISFLDSAGVPLTGFDGLETGAAEATGPPPAKQRWSHSAPGGLLYRAVGFDAFACSIVRNCGGETKRR
jgi:hypothetical protein